jgi:hypothetical protein
MRKPIAVALTLLACAAPARAIVTTHDQEQFGNAPFSSRDGAWAHIAAVLNLPGRTYWRDSGSTGFGSDHHAIRAAYRGGPEELNAALRVMAALPPEVPHEVILLPGGGGTVAAKDGSRVACNWRVAIEYSHQYTRVDLAKDPAQRLAVTLTAFVPEQRPPAVAATPAEVDAWIAGLDAPRFADRQQAERELALRAAEVRPAVERALAGRPTAEQRQRLQRLLQLSSAVDLARLTVPAGLRLVSIDRLIERERVSLLSHEPATLWGSAQVLDAAVSGTDLLPLLTAALTEPERVALAKKTDDAPKGYLLALKPLTTDPAPTPAERAEAAGRYRELRQRLDEFCRSRLP